MKKFILLTLIIWSTLLFSGCSNINDFYIANNSNDILEVELKWDKDLYDTPYKFNFEKFNDKTFEKLEDISGFTKEEIELAEQANTFRVLLEPKQALRIHRINHPKKEKIRTTVDESFRINFLRLKGKTGTIEMTGDAIWFQFREIDNDYFIIYK